MKKICTSCKQPFPATAEYFYKDKSRRDKLHPYCKKCQLMYSQQYRCKNRKKIQHSRRKSYKQNPSKEILRNNQYKRTLKGYVVNLISSIKYRCCNPDCFAYKYYGSCGIKLRFTCVELLQWLGENQIEPRGLEIHRIDNNKDYTLSNIEFLTKKEHTIIHHTQRRKNAKTANSKNSNRA